MSCLCFAGSCDLFWKVVTVLKYGHGNKCMMMTIMPALKQPRIVQLNLLVLKVSYSILTTHYSVLTLMTLNSHHTQHALLRSDSK